MAYSLLFTTLTSQIINSWPNRKLLDYGYMEQVKDIIPNIILACMMGIIVYPVKYTAACFFMRQAAFFICFSNSYDTSRCRKFGPATRPRPIIPNLENIRRYLTIEDYSRVDGMIALWLRSNGHSRESVEEIIRACAPTIRKRQTVCNWQRYAERTVDYA